MSTREWLTIKETVAELESLGLRISERFLSRRRKNHNGPPFWQNGSKVYYHAPGLRPWFESHISKG